MGNLQPLITQTLLPGTKEAYGQLPLQDFNLLEQQLITAYGQSKIKSSVIPLNYDQYDQGTPYLILL